MSAVTTTKSDLGDSRVRVEVEVDAKALDRELNAAAAEIGKDLKMPGFRKGKVPAQVVIQRMGRESVLDDAIRRGLGEWYGQAISDAKLATVGDPKIELSDLPEKGAPLKFSFEVGVRPVAKLGDLSKLEVGRREPAVDPAHVTAELDRLRESLASLETVERAAAEGDFVVMDFLGKVDGEPFEGGEARGFMLELGSGRLIPGFEDQLVGASAGDDVEVKVTFPEEYQAEALAGKDAVFETSVKEIKEKRLPEMDDELAVEAGGFDSLDELRSDIEGKLRENDEARVDQEFREAAVDAAVALSKVDIPHDLVHAKAHDMWAETARRLRQQGLDPSAYLQMMGKEEEEFVGEHEEEAEKALARESVLAALVEAEAIEVSDEDLLTALREAAAGPGGEEPDEKAVAKTLEHAKETGRDELLREDMAMRRAVDLLVERADPIPAEQAEARDKLWTPEKDAEKGDKEIWTPDS
ncbi:MAG: trigger factor [Thermoleophilaceae bacterium]|nr:trigger factor [Thermoleophilaceae bacterium]